MIAAFSTILALIAGVSYLLRKSDRVAIVCKCCGRPGREMIFSYLQQRCILCFLHRRRTKLEYVLATKVERFFLFSSHRKEAWLKESSCAAECMDKAFIVFGSRKCVGWRDRIDDFSFTNSYRWLSYCEVRRKTHMLGYGISEACNISRGAVVGLMACVSVPWLITDFACLLKGFIMVPINKSSTRDCVAHIIRDSGIEVLVVTEHLKYLLFDVLRQISESAGTTQCLRHLVWIEDDAESYLVHHSHVQACQNHLSFSDVQQHRWNELASPRGSENSFWHMEFGVSADSLAKLLPTSGSTDLPKLAIVTDAMLRPRHPTPTSTSAAEGGVQLVYDIVRQPTDLLFAGGCMGVYSGSLLRLFSDCRALAPTSFCAAPTLWNGLFREFETELAGRLAASGSAASAGDERLRLLLEWRERQVLGARMRVLVSTGAPVEHAVCRWAVRALGCPLLDAYGTTETGAVAADGGPATGVEVRLLDRPELGYTAADVPRPRGEIAVRSPRASPGYFSALAGAAGGGGEGDKGPDWVRLDGGRPFFRTGDIGELLPGGQVRIIDRAGAHVKLSQGRFVAPGRVEAALLAGPYAAQAFVHGCGAMDRVLAVVVPAPALVSDALLGPGGLPLLPRGGGGGDDDDALERDAGRRRLMCGVAAYAAAAERLLREWVAEMAVERGLAAWEAPGRVVLEAEAFSAANGLLTPNGKLCRPALVRRYRHLWAAPPDEPPSPAPAPREAGGGLRAGCPGLWRLLESIGAAGGASDAEPGWAPGRLGLDSMGLARLSAAAERRYGAVLSPAQLAAAPSLRAVEDALLGAAPPRAAAVAPMRWDREVRRAWETLEAELAADDDASAAEAEATVAVGGEASVAAGRGAGGLDGVVLMTGCTGFLGAFVLDEFVRRHPAPPLAADAATGPRVRVVCLVRAADDSAAAARLRAALEGYELVVAGGPLDEALRAGAVAAVAGDVSLRRLGLADGAWRALAAAVTAVYHCAAAVDGTAAYAALAPHNVHGTARVLALALHAGGGGRRVEVNHVSTLGCVGRGAPERLGPEAGGGPEGLAGGYAQSKWVAEQVVFLAARERGAVVRVLRPGTVWGHSRTGASNPRDAAGMLLCGLARAGLLPAGDAAVPAEWNLCPVDFVAAATVHIAAQPATAGGAFHLCAHAPISLRTLAGWLAGLGYPLAPATPAQFRAAAKAAPEDHPLFLAGRMLAPHSAADPPPALPSGATAPDRRRACAALAELAAAPAACITREGFAAAVGYWQRAGLLPQPQGPRASRQPILP